MPVMKAISAPSSPVPAVAKIKAELEEFRALEADFKNDRTLELARIALDGAKAAAVTAAVEDDSIDPEELVDRRLEARRQVEIAEIRLGRSEKAVESRGQVVRTPLIEAGKIAAEALREAAEPLGKRLETELRKLIGDDYYNPDAGHYKSLIYRKGEVLNAHARQMESAVSISGLNQAIALLEDAARLG